MKHSISIIFHCAGSWGTRLRKRQSTRTSNSRRSNSKVSSKVSPVQVARYRWSPMLPRLPPVTRPLPRPMPTASAESWESRRTIKIPTVTASKESEPTTVSPRFSTYSSFAVPTRHQFQKPSKPIREIIFATRFIMQPRDMRIYAFN